MRVPPLLGQRDLQVMTGNGLMEGDALERRPRLRWRIVRVDPPAPRPLPVGCAGDIGVGTAALLLEREAGIDDHVASGKSAEPAGHGRPGPLDGRLGRCDDLIPAAEGAVGPKPLIQRWKIGAAEAPLRQRAGLGLDDLHLPEAKLVDRPSVLIHRGELPHAGPITLGAIG
jgi:hypothetical protein